MKFKFRLPKKAFLPFIKLVPLFTLILTGLSKFFAKIAYVFNLLKGNRKFILSVIYIAIIISITQVAFAVMIYGFKMDNKAVRLAAKIVPYPVAIVNQDTITYKDYFAEKDYIYHFYQSTKQEDIDFSAIDKEVLNQLIENKLIAYQARIKGIKVDQKDVDNALNDIIAQNGGADKVSKVLNDLYGIDLTKFRRLVKTQMLREKVSNELIAKVTVRHILVRVDKDATQDKVDAAKAKIDGYLKEVDSGLDFSEAAKKYSEDVGSAEQGGKLEPFAAGEMVVEFSSMAFKTEVGKISEPVISDFGWHIIKVDAKTGKIQESFADWLQSIRKKSFILNL